MFPVGHVLDATYRIERLLGKGGMAYVYAVSHVRLPRRFALKVITAPIAQGSEYVMRFRREAEILAELEHPNLVAVNDWNITPDGKPYLVMELLSGEDLAQCLHRTGALPTKVALSIFSQVAEALQVAHARSIVHRDLKPANIFLCKNGVVPYFAKVLDFGIAKSAQHAGGAVTEN
jgi:eukaryotic-like serine/threonine-protein kinase